MLGSRVSMKAVGYVNGQVTTHISTLCAKEMSDVPFTTASHHHLALNGRLAAAASRAEELVEIEMAVKPQSVVPVFHLTRALFLLDRLAVRSALYTRHTFFALTVWLGIERDAFECFAAVVADEAFRVEALTGCADDAAGNGESTLSALCRGAPCEQGRPMRLCGFYWRSGAVVREWAAFGGINSWGRKRPGAWLSVGRIDDRDGWLGDRRRVGDVYGRNRWCRDGVDSNFRRFWEIQSRNYRC